ncbi:glutamate--tRNA ligase [Clostridium sulfidigenes]|uniref:Glutamine--tRNA ligase n=1 Tax=Clostridium sulfidigenes TaxID=318464 RepID=A0A084J9Y9_9CLOT|nr:glutamine--tRNA ligase/YqeY domain fusion protein [Clostridium sulfidigenes]KEZ85773.1 glutamate--tRNA ligase [Clostridium sulfidigenes]
MCNENDSLNFVDRLVKEDINEGKCDEIHTRFPPEPNGYLHIGSAYAINISYGIAKKYNGKFNLRFDDTNPGKEDHEYVDAIVEDMKWMGFDYEDRLFYGSDYSGKIYNYALYLIRKGKAYVCNLTPDEVREYRGTLTTPGKNSPYRDRTIEENLELFDKMKSGKYKEGEAVLRAKIDMASPNMNMRDPVIYRISYTQHYKTGTQWCIYPMYDYAHPIQDYIEGVSHSLCSNEFKDHRPLYEWVLNELDLDNPKPRQIEFGRMNLSGVVTSKRYLKMLVASGEVDGWDDPRLSTLKGMRRRGYTREAILNFLREIGVAKADTLVDVAMLENSLRQDLKLRVPSVMAVLDPIKVVVTNLPEEHLEYLTIENNGENEDLGKREMPFTKELYIEREDFSENPPKKYNRLVLDGEVRLKGAYFIKCNEVIKNESGEIVELRCSYDPETKSGSGFTGRKVKGTIHWVSAKYGVPCEVRLFENLFNDAPSGDNLFEYINKNSLEVKKNAIIEPAALRLNEEGRFQFIRHGYFIRDTRLSKEKLVFNRTVSLKNSYKK